MKANATKADLLREIARLDNLLRETRRINQDMITKVSVQQAELDEAETKGEKSRFAQKWRKKLIEALGLNLETDGWDDIETAAAWAHEELSQFDNTGVPYNRNEMVQLVELLEDLGYQQAAVRCALASTNPVATLKAWG